MWTCWSNAESEHHAETISCKKGGINQFCKPERLESTKTMPHCGGVSVQDSYITTLYSAFKKLFKGRRKIPLIKEVHDTCREVTRLVRGSCVVFVFVLFFFFLQIATDCTYSIMLLRSMQHISNGITAYQKICEGVVRLAIM